MLLASFKLHLLAHMHTSARVRVNFCLVVSASPSPILLVRLSASISPDTGTVSVKPYSEGMLFEYSFNALAIIRFIR